MPLEERLHTLIHLKALINGEELFHITMTFKKYHFTSYRSWWLIFLWYKCIFQMIYFIPTHDYFQYVPTEITFLKEIYFAITEQNENISYKIMAYCWNKVCNRLHNHFMTYSKTSNGSFKEQFWEKGIELQKNPKSKSVFYSRVQT